jgi:hypothetical protein
MTGPRKSPPLRLLGRLVEVLQGHGYHSADEQARVLCAVALLLAGASGVIYAQQEEAKKQ